MKIPVRGLLNKDEWRIKIDPTDTKREPMIANCIEKMLYIVEAEVKFTRGTGPANDRPRDSDR